MSNYSTKDIALQTDIAESTVRKYAQLLEANGYVFDRNASGYRIFSKQDIEVFEEFKKVAKEKSVEETADIVASKFVAKVVTKDKNVPTDMHNSQGLEADALANLTQKVDALTDMYQNQAKFNEELLKRLDQQQRYIDGRLNERDKMLMESLKETMETRKLIAAAHEEEKKEGFFTRLFGRNKKGPK